jgi:signal transduction histidine kinase
MDVPAGRRRGDGSRRQAASGPAGAAVRRTPLRRGLRRRYRPGVTFASVTPAARAPFLARLTGRRVVTALVLGVLGAWLLNPIFITSFPVLLGRTLVLALVLLLAYVGAESVPDRWLPRWLPRWAVQVLGVATAAPLATFAVYVVAVGGRLEDFFQSPARLTGFVSLSGTALIAGLLLALGALVREREAQARAPALQFALERATLERQALDARLALLSAQIEPHFLFNTLANVQALVESGSPSAAEVLRSLIAYLRAAVPRLHDDAGATLGTEAALVRSYLELMRMRMPDRLSFVLAIDPSLQGEPLPPMTLLTLVENAVQHGIDPSEAGGRIDVGAARAADGSLRLWVADSGVGLSDSAGPGTGLSNLRARLQARFGARARLELGSLQPHGLHAEITIAPESAR